MAKTYKKKAKVGEMDTLIKKVGVKVASIVSDRLKKIEALEEKENDAAYSVIICEAEDKDGHIDLSHLQHDFEIKLSCWCASKKGKICDRNNLPCKVKLCPIIQRNL